MSRERLEQLRSKRRLAELRLKANAPTVQNEGDSVGAAVEGFGQGASLGYLAELQALAGQLVPDPNRALDNELRKQGFSVNQGKDDYVTMRDENVRRQEALAKSNPVAYHGGMVAGGIATAPAIEARLARALPAAATSSVLRRGLTSGAVLGAAANPGSTDGEIAPLQLIERAKGAAMGAAGGAALAGLSKLLPKGRAASPSVPATEKLPLLQEKRNAAQIRAAAKELGVELTDAQALDNGFLQQLDSLLQQSPTMVGRRHADTVTRGLKAAEKVAEDALEGATERTASEVGARAKSSIVGKIRAENQPISELYNRLRDSTQHMDLSPRSLEAISRNVSKLREANIGPTKGLVRGIAEDIKNLKTVDDVKFLRTQIRRGLPPTASPAEKAAVANIDRRLRALEESTVVRAAKQAVKDTRSPNTGKDILRLIDERKLADQQYSQSMRKMEDFGEVIGIRRVGSPEAFAQKILDVPEEEFARRLFAKNNAKGLKYLQEQFPEEAAEILSLEKAKLLERHMKDGRINTGALLRDVQKYSPEVREALFGQDGVKRLQSARTYLESLGPKANPSGTTTAAEALSFFENPVRAAGMTARDIIIKGVLTGAKKLDTPAVERAFRAAGAARDAGRSVAGRAGESLHLARSPLSQVGGPERRAYTGPERRRLGAENEEAPGRGPEKWASDGLEKIRKHSGDSAMVDSLREQLLADPRGRELLIHASSLKPGSRALESLLGQIRRRYAAASGS